MSQPPSKKNAGSKLSDALHCRHRIHPNERAKPAPGEHASSWQETQRVELLYKHPLTYPLTSAFAGTLGLFLIGAILYASMKLDRILWWLAVAVPVQLLWIPLYWQFRKHKSTVRVTRWKHAHGAMSLRTGLCLAATPLMIFPLSGIEDRMIVIVMFAGFIAVAANTNAPWPPSFALYSYPPGIATMIMMWAQMTPESLGKAAMRNTTRQEDVVARLGGDGFVIVIFPASMEQANRVAEKLRHKITQLAIASNDAGQILSASIGIAIAAATGFDPDTLLAQSDEACYRAKRGGRNRCEFASI